MDERATITPGTFIMNVNNVNFDKHKRSITVTEHTSAVRAVPAR